MPADEGGPDAWPMTSASQSYAVGYDPKALKEIGKLVKQVASQGAGCRCDRRRSATQWGSATGWLSRIFGGSESGTTG